MEIIINYYKLKNNHTNDVTHLNKWYKYITMKFSTIHALIILYVAVDHVNILIIILHINNYLEKCM